ncbi:MAG: energy-coupling factor transporter transmembrane component T [Anaerovoracaceae bacterium]
MIFINPIVLAISFMAAFSYAVLLAGRKALLFALAFITPVMLISVLINLLFNNRGATAITTPSGSPITIIGESPISYEALIYGFSTALMFAAILMWFFIYNKVFTSDKFLYLFGRSIPNISLIFSMVLSFLPRFIAQAKVISAGQKALGRDISDGKLREKVANGMRILSILVTWAFENSIETADSMKARGFGTAKRTNYLDFKFTIRDTVLVLLITISFMASGLIYYFGNLRIFFYPEWFFQPKGNALLLLIIFFSVLSFLPIFVNLFYYLKFKVAQNSIGKDFVKMPASFIEKQLRVKEGEQV